MPSNKNKLPDTDRLTEINSPAEALQILRGYYNLPDRMGKGESSLRGYELNAWNRTVGILDVIETSLEQHENMNRNVRPDGTRVWSTSHEAGWATIKLKGKTLELIGRLSSKESVSSDDLSIHVVVGGNPVVPLVVNVYEEQWHKQADGAEIRRLIPYASAVVTKDNGHIIINLGDTPPVNSGLIIDVLHKLLS